MSDMLRKAVDKSEAMETALKWSLLERVNDCVKELQLKTTSERSNALVNDEATNSFLWVLEAVFIHGLSNSFLKASSPFSSLMSSSLFSGRRRSGGFGGVSVDTSASIPNPSFWEFVLVFLHRDIIDQINSLHLVHTDVGRSRAWLRIALNEGLLLSFLENMTLKSNKRCLKAFYKTSALLRDMEKCDILKNYLMGIELLDFRLVINNSFLNHWNSGPLSLVGLWVDENESIQQGIDIAQNLESKELQAIPKLQHPNTPPRFYSELEQQLRRQTPALLSEEDALRIILSSSPRHPPAPPLSRSPQPSTSNSSLVVPFVRHISPKTETKIQIETPKVDLLALDNPSNLKEQLLLNPPTDSTTSDSDKHVITPCENPKLVSQSRTEHTLNTIEENVPEPQHPVEVEKMVTETKTLELESPMTEQSYYDMLLKYQQRNQQEPQEKDEATNELVSSNNENVLLDQNNSVDESQLSSSGCVTTYSPSSTSGSVCGSNQSVTRRRKRSYHSRNRAEVDAAELLKAPRNTKMELMELMPRINKFTKILANEIGLDSQNYACKECGSSIGMFYGAARLCHFTGYSYCSNCHLNEEKVIPSRILLNWDFGVYTVSKQAHDFLDESKDQPIFDVQEINPLLYSEIDECAQVKTLRTKLFYIAMYLKTCKHPKALEKVKEAVKDKEYLLDSVHLFSLSDLLDIPNRSLITLLTTLVSTGSEHILSCVICRDKGFICEVCRVPQVVFPFELEKIYKCNHCGAVYHSGCMDTGKKCPRCERWKQNESKTPNDNDNE